MMLKLREFTNSAAILSVTPFHSLDYESASQTNFFFQVSQKVLEKTIWLLIFQIFCNWAL